MYVNLCQNLIIFNKYLYFSFFNYNIKIYFLNKIIFFKFVINWKNNNKCFNKEILVLGDELDHLPGQ